MRNAELRNEWIRALKRQNKDKTEWKPSVGDKVCSIHLVRGACEAEEKKTRRTLIRQHFPKKSKIKDNDVNDEDYVVPLTIFTTESQPTDTCTTPHNWSATPLASSLDHSHTV